MNPAKAIEELENVLSSEDAFEVARTVWEWRDEILTALRAQGEPRCPHVITTGTTSHCSLAEAEVAQAKAELAAEREALAQLMLRHSLPTGHGDTHADLVAALDAEIAAMRVEEKATKLLREINDTGVLSIGMKKRISAYLNAKEGKG